jgi:hypothetical protein
MQTPLCECVAMLIGFTSRAASPMGESMNGSVALNAAWWWRFS